MANTKELALTITPTRATGFYQVWFDRIADKCWSVTHVTTEQPKGEPMPVGPFTSLDTALTIIADDVLKTQY